MSQKNLDKRGRWRDRTIAFRVSEYEWKEIHERAGVCGMQMQTYLTRAAIYQKIVFVGEKRNLDTIRKKQEEINRELKRIRDASEITEDRLSALWIIMEILDATFQPQIPLIDGMLYEGTYLFAGSPKVGKSFMMAQMIHQGLEEQLMEFLKEHPDTKLVIIDTLQKVRTIGEDKSMYGRDQPDTQIDIIRDRERCYWKLEKMERELWKEPPEPVVEKIVQFLTTENSEWTGSASELLEALEETDMAPNVLTRRLNTKVELLLREYSIEYSTTHTHKERTIKLKRITK